MAHTAVWTMRIGNSGLPCFRTRLNAVTPSTQPLIVIMRIMSTVRTRVYVVQVERRQPWSTARRAWLRSNPLTLPTPHSTVSTVMSTRSLMVKACAMPCSTCATRRITAVRCRTIGHSGQDTSRDQGKCAVCLATVPECPTIRRMTNGP